MPIKKWLVGAICGLLWLPLLQADDRPLLAIDAYMPAVPPVSRTAAVYLQLKNTSPSKIVLTGISTAIAKHAMIHRTIESDGVVKMKHLSKIEITSGNNVEFTPGGMHIMLMGLQKDVIPETFDLKLIFENQTSQVISVTVRRPLSR